MGSLCPGLDENGVSLLAGLLAMNPSNRMSAAQALEHPYFEEERRRDQAMAEAETPKADSGRESVPVKTIGSGVLSDLGVDAVVSAKPGGGFGSSLATPASGGGGGGGGSSSDGVESTTWTGASGPATGKSQRSNGAGHVARDPLGDATSHDMDALNDLLE